MYTAAVCSEFTIAFILNCLLVQLSFDHISKYFDYLRGYKLNILNKFSC